MKIMPDIPSKTMKNKVVFSKQEDQHDRGQIWDKVKPILKWVLTGLPLTGIIFASFLPLRTWMQQALVLVTLIWFYVFFLLDTFFLGG
jgi:hypothetical protein